MSTVKTPLNELPHIDWELCIKLANNKIEVAEEILSFVLQQLPADYLDIQSAYQKQDAAELLRATHKLHGALCYTGLPQLKQIVLEIESHLKEKNNDAEHLTEMMKHLDCAVKTALSHDPSKGV